MVLTECLTEVIATPRKDRRGVYHNFHRSWLFYPFGGCQVPWVAAPWYLHLVVEWGSSQRWRTTRCHGPSRGRAWGPGSWKLMGSKSWMKKGWFKRGWWFQNQQFLIDSVHQLKKCLNLGGFPCCMMRIPKKKQVVSPPIKLKQIRWPCPAGNIADGFGCPTGCFLRRHMKDHTDQTQTGPRQWVEMGYPENWMVHTKKKTKSTVPLILRVDPYPYQDCIGVSPRLSSHLALLVLASRRRRGSSFCRTNFLSGGTVRWWWNQA